MPVESRQMSLHAASSNSIWITESLNFDQLQAGCQANTWYGGFADLQSNCKIPFWQRSAREEARCYEHALADTTTTSRLQHPRIHFA